MQEPYSGACKTFPSGLRKYRNKRAQFNTSFTAVWLLYITFKLFVFMKMLILDSLYLFQSFK